MIKSLSLNYTKRLQSKLLFLMSYVTITKENYKIIRFMGNLKVL